jgi:hypothetical protein
MYLKNEEHGSYAPFGAVPATAGALGLGECVLALGLLVRF